MQDPIQNPMQHLIPSPIAFVQVLLCKGVRVYYSWLFVCVCVFVCVFVCVLSVLSVRSVLCVLCVLCVLSACVCLMCA